MPSRSPTAHRSAVARSNPASCNWVEVDSKLLTDADGDVLRLEILVFALAGVLQALCRGRAKVVGLAQTRRDRFAVICRETWICWRNLRMRCEEERTRTLAVSGWGSGAGD